MLDNAIGRATLGVYNWCIGSIGMFKFTKRVHFPRHGQQKQFLMEALSVRGETKSQYARMLGVHPRTFSDWTREQYSLPINVFLRILKRTGMPTPEVQVRRPFWNATSAAKKGGIVHYKKYGRVAGDEEFRKKRWHEWWKRTGKYNQTKWFLTRPISTPRKNARLAEFVGILMGDGGITERQIKVTLNRVDDKDYVRFVAREMSLLFGVMPSIIPVKDRLAVNIIISRTKLVEFCISIGLNKGNKLMQGLDIPDWILKNEAYAKACVRGLIDTDGSIFNERHTIKGKQYCYPRMSFVSASPDLCDSVIAVLRKNGFSPKLRNNRSVNLERREDIVRYFKQIGSHNVKHVRRFEKFTGGVA